MDNKIPLPKDPRKKEARNKRRNKRRFVKKDRAFVCSAETVEEVKIYADDEADAMKIFLGIHKVPFTSFREVERYPKQQKQHKKQEHLTDRPFAGLEERIVSEEKTDGQ